MTEGPYRTDIRPEELRTSSKDRVKWWEPYVVTIGLIVLGFVVGYVTRWTTGPRVIQVEDAVCHDQVLYYGGGEFACKYSDAHIEGQVPLTEHFVICRCNKNSKDGGP